MRVKSISDVIGIEVIEEDEQDLKSSTTSYQNKGKESANFAGSKDTRATNVDL